MPNLVTAVRSWFNRLNGGGPGVEYHRLDPSDFRGMLAPVSQ